MQSQWNPVFLKIGFSRDFILYLNYMSLLKISVMIHVKSLKIIVCMTLTLMSMACNKSTVQPPVDPDDNSGEIVNPQPFPSNLPTAEEAWRWWPEQKAPKSVAVCRYDNRLPEHMLAQSISGLAAQAVNEGVSDEMVWLYRPDGDAQLWFQKMKAEKAFADAGEFTTWELLQRYIDKGIVKGYILFTSVLKNQSTSVNPATVLASIKKAVLIEEDLEEKAKSLGLTMLADARNLTEEDCLMQYKQELNRKMVVALEPKLTNIRDFAIAHKALCIYGTGDFEKMVMNWLEPFSPVFGWNKGDEYIKTSLASRYGHFIVPSSLCYNLPLYCAESEKVPIIHSASVDPKTLDYDTDLSYHSFVMSDGDNFRYMTNNFYDNEEFWAHPANKSIPISWGSCPVMMTMGNPYAWNQIASEATPGAMMEFGGGYHYPDEFAIGRKNRDAHQRIFAQMLNLHFQNSGVKIIANIYKDRDSPRAQKAMQVFAEEIDGLVGLLALSYNPYEDGKGEIKWVKNKEGVEIPVLYPKYCLWAGLNKPYKGNPSKISRLINTDAEATQNFNATIIHAWSHYIQTPNGEVIDSDSNNPEAEGGVGPVLWTKEKLDPKTQVVTLEELFWRIRMKYREEETRRILGLSK